MGKKGLGNFGTQQLLAVFGETVQSRQSTSENLSERLSSRRKTTRGRLRGPSSLAVCSFPYGLTTRATSVAQVLVVEFPAVNSLKIQ